MFARTTQNMFAFCMLMVSTIICEGPQKRNADLPARLWYVNGRMTSIPQRIQVRIKNGQNIESFSFRADSSAAALYRTAETLGIIEQWGNMALCDSNGFVLLDDRSVTLCSILPPPTSRADQSVLDLVVHSHERISITVIITNGNRTKKFRVNASTRSSEVYARAVKIGIMDNYYQFLLRWKDNDRADRVLIPDDDTSVPITPLIDLMYSNLTELELSVVPLPEGLLFFSSFKDMAPNQEIPSWNLALFCHQNPWHVHCSNLLRIMEYDDNVDAADINKTISRSDHSDNVSEEWSHGHYTLHVPSWSGILHLEYVPRCIHSLSLKGKSVRVALEAAQFSSLIELTLDFNNIIGIDFAALSRTSLQILRLPSHSGFNVKELGRVLERLNAMRKQHDKIPQLKRIELGLRRQIVYDSYAEQYRYIAARHSKRDRTLFKHFQVS